MTQAQSDLLHAARRAYNAVVDGGGSPQEMVVSRDVFNANLALYEVMGTKLDGEPRFKAVAVRVDDEAPNGTIHIMS